MTSSSLRRHRSPQLAALRALQLGEALPATLSFRGELSLLSHYHAPEPPFRTAFSQYDGLSPPRNAYIVDQAASADRALLALASTDGRIELHEPDAADSHRLTLKLVAPHAPSQRAQLSALAFPAFPQDTLFAAMSTRHVHHYDLNTCGVDRPSGVLTLRVSPTQGVTDVAEVAFPNVVAVAPSRLALFDMRLRGNREALAAPLSAQTPVVVAQGTALIVGHDRNIRVYDKRKLPLPSSDARVSARSLSMGARDPGANPCGLLCDFTPRLPAQSRIAWLGVPPNAPHGYLAVQTSSGATGFLDLVSQQVDLVSETTSPVRSAAAALPEFNLRSESPSAFVWHVRRRRCDVVPGVAARGWRIVAPYVERSGVRVVASGLQLPTSQFHIPVLDDVHVASVSAVGDGLQRLVLGTTSNDVHVVEVDVARTYRNRHNADRDGT